MCHPHPQKTTPPYHPNTTILPHHTSPHHITPHHTTSRHTTPHHATPHHITPHHTVHTSRHTSPYTHHATPHRTHITPHSMSHEEYEYDSDFECEEKSLEAVYSREVLRKMKKEERKKQSVILGAFPRCHATTTPTLHPPHSHYHTCTITPQMHHHIHHHTCTITSTHRTLAHRTHSRSQLKGDAQPHPRSTDCVSRRILRHPPIPQPACRHLRAWWLVVVLCG